MKQSIYIFLFILFPSITTCSESKKIIIPVTNNSEGSVLIGKKEDIQAYIKGIKKQSKDTIKLDNKKQRLSFSLLDQELQIYEVEPKKGSSIIILSSDIMFKDWQSVKKIQ